MWWTGPDRRTAPTRERTPRRPARRCGAGRAVPRDGAAHPAPAVRAGWWRGPTYGVPAPTGRRGAAPCRRSARGCRARGGPRHDRSRAARASTGVADSTRASSRSAMAWRARTPSLTALSGTKWTPSGNAGSTPRATSSASRVLPTPPGPSSVTSRRPLSSAPVTSTTSASRPTVSVIGTGTALDTGPSPPGPATAPPEPLQEQDGEIVHDQSLELLRGREPLVRREIGGLQIGEESAQPILPIGRRLLEVQQAGAPARQPVLVLEAGHPLAGSHPPVALPVDPEEHVALLQVRTVELPWWMGPGPQLEQHRCQMGPLDGPTHRLALRGQLTQRRADEDPEALVGRPDGNRRLVVGAHGQRSRQGAARAWRSAGVPVLR
jgi:hypothetical protein